MPKSLKVLLLIFLIFTLVAKSSLYADGELVNPSFSQPPVSGVQIVARPSAIVGWKITKGSIDVVNLASQPGYAGNFQGNPQAIDLNGYLGSTPKGCAATIYQDVPTTKGRLYTYTFGMAANTADDPRVKSLKILWGTPDGDMTLVGNYSTSSAKFTEHHFTVKAEGTTSRLMLVSTTDSMSNYGAYICFSVQQEKTERPRTHAPLIPTPEPPLPASGPGDTIP